MDIRALISLVYVFLLHRQVSRFMRMFLHFVVFWTVSCIIHDSLSSSYSVFSAHRILWSEFRRGRLRQPIPINKDAAKEFPDLRLTLKLISVVPICLRVSLAKKEDKQKIKICNAEQAFQKTNRWANFYKHTGPSPTQTRQQTLLLPTYYSIENVKIYCIYYISNTYKNIFNYKLTNYFI